MESREAKLALARRKLKDHQEKKQQVESISKVVDYEIGNMSQSDHISQNKFQPHQLECDASSENYQNNSGKCGSISSEQQQSEINIDSDQPWHSDFNPTEILISNKRNLELQIEDLQIKLVALESNLAATSQNYEVSCQKVLTLENNLENMNYKYQMLSEQLITQDKIIKDLSETNSKVLDDKNNLLEQLEFTRTVLTAKEAENESLQSHMFAIQNQLDVSQLQLQQLTNGSQACATDNSTDDLKYENEVLIQKVSSLEQKLKQQLNDYEQLNIHYENYVSELNKQLQLFSKKNDDLLREVQHLSNRENSLIEQIGEMEIQLQDYRNNMNGHNNDSEQFEIKELSNPDSEAVVELNQLRLKYDELQTLYKESCTKLHDLNLSKEVHQQNSEDTVSLQKLSADMASDKIAAQKATEQNKKLKQDIQGLEEAFVKITKDKLELTEKIAAEKFLNRELTVKLADIDEKATDMKNKLKAKDEEMIRLQTSYRVLEKHYKEIAENLRNLEANSVNHQQSSENETASDINEHTNLNDYEDHSLIEHSDIKNSQIIRKDDAMVKLQERFLKIMGDVADLSDEKHRLEHIITQLQNETDTICEYVALYQNQRSLLKKRDEERSAQMKLFQSECLRLQSQLNELTKLLERFAGDKQLSSYFQIETKQEDLKNVMNLLSNLKANSLIDPEKTIRDLNDFYPCSCCSGQLIEV